MKTVLLVNSPDAQCGVHQFAISVHKILQGSRYYRTDLYKFASLGELITISRFYDYVIFNYHEKLFPWLNESTIDQIHGIKLAIGGHDCYPNFDNISAILDCDSTRRQTGKIYPLSRPVFDYYNHYIGIENEAPVIGSFGFPFASKNFDTLIDLVAQNFDSATVNIHAPRHFQGDQFDHILQSVRAKTIGYPGLSVNLSTRFMDTEGVIDFLARNDINVFLYPKMEGRGLSSVIDYALAARRPIAISNSEQFRHIDMEPKIRLDKYSLKDILSFGTAHLEQFHNLWNEEKLVRTYESVLDSL